MTYKLHTFLSKKTIPIPIPISISIPVSTAFHLLSSFLGALSSAFLFCSIFITIQSIQHHAQSYPHPHPHPHAIPIINICVSTLATVAFSYSPTLYESVLDTDIFSLQICIIAAIVLVATLIKFTYHHHHHHHQEMVCLLGFLSGLAISHHHSSVFFVLSFTVPFVFELCQTHAQITNTGDGDGGDGDGDDDGDGFGDLWSYVLMSFCLGLLLPWGWTAYCSQFTSAMSFGGPLRLSSLKAFLTRTVYEYREGRCHHNHHHHRHHHSLHHQWRHHNRRHCNRIHHRPQPPIYSSNSIPIPSHPPSPIPTPFPGPSFTNLASHLGLYLKAIASDKMILAMVISIVGMAQLYKSRHTRVWTRNILIAHMLSVFMIGLYFNDTLTHKSSFLLHTRVPLYYCLGVGLHTVYTLLLPVHTFPTPVHTFFTLACIYQQLTSTFSPSPSPSTIPKPVPIFTDAILSSFPTGAMVLLGDGFASQILPYYQQCEHQREDLVLLNTAQMTWGWFPDTIPKTHSAIRLPARVLHPFKEDGYTINEFIHDNYETFPIFICGALPVWDGAEKNHDSYQVPQAITITITITITIAISSIATKAMSISIPAITITFTTATISINCFTALDSGYM